MLFSSLRRTVRELGWSGVAEVVALRAANRATYVRSWRVLDVSALRPPGATADPRLRHGFLDEETLLGAQRDSDLDLPDEFVTEAFAKGDSCYGFLDGDRLINFGWFSTAPTILCDDRMVCVPSGYVYSYKDFTHPSHRGQRLHAIGKTMALRAYLGLGYRGMVCSVSSTNLASLRSLHRVGAKEVGRLFVVRAGRLRITQVDEACAALGVSVRIRSAAAPMLDPDDRRSPARNPPISLARTRASRAPRPATLVVCDPEHRRLAES
jgi:hypothetical protein